MPACFPASCFFAKNRTPSLVRPRPPPKRDSIARSALREPGAALEVDRRSSKKAKPHRAEATKGSLAEVDIAATALAGWLEVYGHLELRKAWRSSSPLLRAAWRSPTHQARH
jgi:hypothetical protein